MAQESEIVTLIIASAVLFFILANHRRFTRLPGYILLLTAFLTLYVGWVFTILEGFWLNNFFNVGEHILYSISSVIVAVWCWRILKRNQVA